MVGLLIVWEFIGLVFFPGRNGAVPPPTRIVSHMIDDGFMFYWHNARDTIYEAAVGWFWGNLLAIMLAFSFLILPILERPLTRLGVVSYCLPITAVAPILSISAKTGQRVGRVLEAAIDIWGERRKRISTGELNRVLMAATERTPPPPVRGHRPKLFYATQAAVAPPTFVFFASDASSVHFSYRRYLENQLRAKFGFDGTPIRLVFRDRSSVKLPRRKKLRSAPAGSAKGARRGGSAKPAARKR